MDITDYRPARGHTLISRPREPLSSQFNAEEREIIAAWENYLARTLEQQQRTQETQQTGDQTDK